MKKLFVMCMLLIPPTYAAEPATSCDLGSGPRIKVEVIGKAPIADTYVYVLRQDGKDVLVFPNAESSRGASMRVTCVGTIAHALVLSGEFGANAVQGSVLTYWPLGGKIERLDLAEKERPLWLYMSSKQTIVIVATSGFGETSKKYRLYRKMVGSNDEVKIEAANELPAGEGYEIVYLDRGGKM